MEQIFRRKAVRARILKKPLGRILQQYIGYIEGRGHGPSTLHQYVFASTSKFQNEMRNLLDPPVKPAK